MSSRGASSMCRPALRRPFLSLLFAAVAFVAACKSSSSPTSKAYDIAALQKIDTVVGTGAEAVNGKTVTVHYTGWLYDPTAVGNRGAKFDSSVDRNQPFGFVLGTG